KKINIIVFLMGVAIITTSCKKDDAVVPTTVAPNQNVTYDTIKQTFNVGVIKADSTLNTSDTYSYYTSTSSYTLILSEVMPNYTTIDDNIKAIEFNENQETFYKIEGKKISNDIQVKLYCDFDTYQSNT